jgi:hypothetical protein
MQHVYARQFVTIVTRNCIISELLSLNQKFGCTKFVKTVSHINLFGRDTNGRQKTLKPMGILILFLIFIYMLKLKVKRLKMALTLDERVDTLHFGDS